MTVLTCQNKCGWKSFLIEEGSHTDTLFLEPVWLEELLWRKSPLGPTRKHTCSSETTGEIRFPIFMKSAEIHVNAVENLRKVFCLSPLNYKLLQDSGSSLFIFIPAAALPDTACLFNRG